MCTTQQHRSGRYLLRPCCQLLVRVRMCVCTCACVWVQVWETLHGEGRCGTTQLARRSTRGATRHRHDPHSCSQKRTGPGTRLRTAAARCGADGGPLPAPSTGGALGQAPHPQPLRWRGRRSTAALPCHCPGPGRPCHGTRPQGAPRGTHALRTPQVWRAAEGSGHWGPRHWGGSERGQWWRTVVEGSGGGQWWRAVVEGSGGG